MFTAVLVMIEPPDIVSPTSLSFVKLAVSEFNVTFERVNEELFSTGCSDESLVVMIGSSLKKYDS